MKKKTPKGWVKISDFKQLTGISSNTIFDAIKQEKISVKSADRVGVAATSPYYLNPEKSAIEWSNNINPDHPLSRPIHEKLTKYISTFKPAAKGETKTNKKVRSITESKRIERDAKASMAVLEFEEKQGILIRKEVVDSELFAAGREIRDALMAVPSRIIDMVNAESGNRNKQLNIICNAIADELEKLYDLHGRIS